MLLLTLHIYVGRPHAAVVQTGHLNLQGKCSGQQVLHPQVCCLSCLEGIGGRSPDADRRRPCTRRDAEPCGTLEGGTRSSPAGARPLIEGLGVFPGEGLMDRCLLVILLLPCLFVLLLARLIVFMLMCLFVSLLLWYLDSMLQKRIKTSSNTKEITRPTSKINNSITNHCTTTPTEQNELLATVLDTKITNQPKT